MGIRVDIRLIEWLRNQHWSEFAQGVVAFYDEHGFITEKQHAAATELKESVVWREGDECPTCGLGELIEGADGILECDNFDGDCGFTDA